MILGKFLPPHRGHQFLVDFAQHYVRDLTVLVCSLAREPIPGELRYRWMREMFPQDNVRIVHVTEDLPQEPSEHPDFWRIWRRVVTDNVTEPIDYVFASEEYGWRLAEVLSAEFVPVDLARELVPVSGTMIRGDPMRHWGMLPECVRPYFVNRVALVGPESTGKSTLAADLAAHFQTAYVWEYARPLLDHKRGRCDPKDIERIALGQLATEDAMCRQANRVLFCDTNVLLTTIWSEVLFGACPQWVTDAARSRRYDLTLLLDVDVPWVDDEQRYFPDQARRVAFFERCRRTLEAQGSPYILIRGGWRERFEQAAQAVERIISAGGAGV